MQPQIKWTGYCWWCSTPDGRYQDGAPGTSPEDAFKRWEALRTPPKPWWKLF